MVEPAIKPRVLLVGRTRYRLPLSASLRPKFEALGARLELRVLASEARPPGGGSDPVFELVAPLRPRLLDGVGFYLRLPFKVARILRSFNPDAVIAQSPYEAVGVLFGRVIARRPTPLVLEVHGDWRTATRLYGSRLRLVLAPLADRVAGFAVRRADAVRTVSSYTSALATRYGVEPAAAFPAYMDLTPFLERPPVPLPSQPVALFVGALEPSKNIDALADAWPAVASRVPGARLRIVGSGSRAAVVERLVVALPGQVSWTPALTSQEVAEALDDASFLVLPSLSEGLGRVIIEALSRSRPVLGTRVGGIVDLIENDVNGVLVEPGDTTELTDALQTLLGDPSRVERLAAASRSSVQPWLLSPDEYAEQTHTLITRIARRRAERPRVLLVGRTRYRLPLSSSLRPKFDALGARLDLRVLASEASPFGGGSDPMFELVPPLRPRLIDGAAFYARLPFHIARLLRSFEPEVVIAQSPYEAVGVLIGRRLALRSTPLVLEVHGDWRTATRLYGSRLRLVLAPFADWVAGFAVRHADAVRTVSTYTSALATRYGVEPAAAFPAYMDLAPFLERPPSPLPAQPTALFVGVLESYKNIEGLIDAWRLVAQRLPGARLRIVGSGSRAALVEHLVDELPDQAGWSPRLASPEVATALDDASFLVLPSRSEGLGRVIIEALCRGRPVLGTRVGGIVDLIEDGVNGVLVEPGDTEALADALYELLSDRTRLERLAAAARSSVQPWLASPEDYADQTHTLITRIVRS
ncbi:MAG TPA: glycosyltransferase family 4 protein [Gaiellaceae bacterium]|nr:glycosyltransferase family 4 protein [Gaiellaceae bacterium]